MQDRYAYLLAFFVPFGLVTFVGRGGMTWPGSNTGVATAGTGLGLLVLAGVWLLSNGISLPGRPDRTAAILIVVSMVVVFGSALPIPAGAAPGEPSGVERTCDCLGTAVTMEATPPFMDVDIRKYCYGIPHSCRAVSATEAPWKFGVHEACATKAQQINDEYCVGYVRTAQYIDAGVANSSRGYAPPDDYMNDSGDRWADARDCTDVRDDRIAAAQGNAGPVSPDGRGGYAYTQTASEAGCGIEAANMGLTVTVDEMEFNCVNQGHIESLTCPVMD